MNVTLKLTANSYWLDDKSLLNRFKFGINWMGAKGRPPPIDYDAIVELNIWPEKIEISRHSRQTNI